MREILTEFLTHLDINKINEYMLSYYEDYDSFVEIILKENGDLSFRYKTKDGIVRALLMKNQQP